MDSSAGTCVCPVRSLTVHANRINHWVRLALLLYNCIIQSTDDERSMTLNLQPLGIQTNASLLAGGTIVVDGLSIIVPDNTIVTLPAAQVAWPELFDPITAAPLLTGTQTWKANVCELVFAFLASLISCRC
jgi:hypothetical protein